MGDKENIDERSASEYLEEELGLKVYSIQNIASIYNLIKDNMDNDTRRIWVEYYNKYGIISLE